MDASKEKLLNETYDRFMDLALKGMYSLDIIDELAVEDVMGYGTTTDEKLFSISALRELLIRQREQSEGIDMQWSIIPVLRRMSPNGGSAVFADDVLLAIRLNDENLKMYLRFSTVFEFLDGKWLAVHWHGSKPENVESEKDTFGIEEWQQKNAELEKKVAQKTAELQKSLEDLKATQAQLIQSEKMASLGELTAGIAHEIQNPLNFVNNFSEVNKELVVELKREVVKGNLEEVKAMADDIEANEEKINHHGKRAAVIVKSMLEHSRTGSGQKELTDINALAEEYLRLSYHGLKAKDKTFNATLKTDFDPSIPKINVVPQDMGRVLLNLYNNAFYAVHEKKRLLNEAYEPIVSVSTKCLNGKVELIVKDNGPGIPQKLLDKIFQPFFTTKPTGQGTGLGLSLSYDIIKAHGGDIKVETTFQTGRPDTADKHSGTTFIILLPDLN